METAELKKTIEALLFISGKAISKDRIATVTDSRPVAVEDAINELKLEWNSGRHGVFIEEIGGGWQISTRPECADYIIKLYPWKGVLRLSPSAAEVLSIILYKQPVTKAQINEIRGVDSQASVATLLKNSLIKYSGRKKAPGNPRLIRISENFYHIFGIRDISDIPSWKDLAEDSRSAEEPEIDETAEEETAQEDE